MLEILFIIIGFVLLVKGADVLIEGASSIAKNLKVPDLVIGLTIVAFGTSAPELFVNIVSSIKGISGIAIGNIVGSNIANVLLVLGISALIRPISVGKGTVWKEIPFSLFAAVMLLFFARNSFVNNGSSVIGPVQGAVFLFFFLVFMLYSFSISKETGMAVDVPQGGRTTTVSVLMLIVGLAGLAFGGKLIVDNAVKVALRFGVSDVVIGLTIVALGTSLPELATSVMAIIKGRMEIAVGNVVGSNILNIFLVLGVSSLINPINIGADCSVNLIVMAVSSLLLFVTMFTGKRRVIDRWEGGLLLMTYAGYISYLVVISV